MDVLVHLQNRGGPSESRTVTLINSVHFRDLQSVLEREFDMPLRITGLKTDQTSVGLYSGQTLANGQSLGSILESWEDVLESGDVDGVEIWVQRPDASGARTPPNLEMIDESSGARTPPLLDDVDQDYSLKDSLGSMANRRHFVTPPESPRSSDDEAESVSSSINLSYNRSRSKSFTGGQRTPPDSPPDSPPMARSVSPPPSGIHNSLLKVSSESSSMSMGSPSSPFLYEVDRLLIPPDRGRPQPYAPTSPFKDPAHSILINSSSSDHVLSLSGSHRTEIGFERSEKALGQGAFGKVWLGLRDNGEFLAIKEIQISKGEKYAQRLEAVENEIDLMRNLDHPHIVRYLGSQRDEARGFFYILLEYVSCGSIQALLKTMGGPLDEKVIRKYSRQILLGLAYLHSRSPPVAHRDIKSANVLVETTGNVKLADFGCSKVFSDLLEGRNFNSVLGTPHWMAPEVIRQEGAGLAADIWSFGCTVVEMATGLPPWSDIRDPTAVMFHIASTSKLPKIPDSLSDIGKDFLKCCFQRDPSRRATAVDLLQHSFVSSDYVANSNLRDINDSDDYYNSLLTQSLSTIPQFLSVLPANLVVFIFQFLTVKDLCSVSLVCKQWRAAAAADSLWEVKSKTIWPWLESSKGNRWRDVYVKASLGNQGWKGSGKLTLDTLRGHGRAVLCMEARKDRLITGGEDKKIRVWSVSKRKCALTLKGHVRAVSAVCSQEDTMLSGGTEGSLRLWDIAGKGKCLRVMEDGGMSGVTGVDMMQASCVSSGDNGVVKFWNAETGKCTLTVQCNVAVTSVRLDGPSRAIWSCNDGSLRVCDVRTKGETGILMGHSDIVTKVQLGKKLGVDARSGFTGKDLICSCSLDGKVKFWDLRSLKAYSTLSAGADEALYSVDFNGSIVACAGKSKTLHVFDLASEESIRSLKQHHTDVIHGVCVERHQIFTCSRDKTIKTLTSATGLSTSGPKPLTMVKPRTPASFLRLPFQQSSEKAEDAK